MLYNLKIIITLQKSCNATKMIKIKFLQNCQNESIFNINVSGSVKNGDSKGIHVMGLCIN